MRCRSETQVPKCFRLVKCPYPQAQTAHGEYGAINYSLSGPEHGEVVVCLHGLNGSRLLFHELSAALSAAQYRVLCFDLYGHGLSNAPPVDLCPCAQLRRCSRNIPGGAPRGRYDLEFFVEQMEDLLELVGLGDAKVNIIGFSLGGAIAVAFAQRYPLRVLRLVPMSPSGFIPKVPPTYYLLRATWCCLIPLAPHLLCTCWYKRDRFEKSIRSDNSEIDDEAIDSLWSRFVWQLYIKRGVASATLAICSRMPWFQLNKTFQDAGRHSRPVLLIWGERDSLNPAATVAQEVKQCFSNAHLKIVPGAGHIAICDRPRQVIPAILAFLRLRMDTRMDKEPLFGSAHQARSRSRPPLPLAPDPRQLDQEGAGGGSRFADRSAQMPVPLILGHQEKDIQIDMGSRDNPSS